MSETGIVWLIGMVVGFSLGFGLGHLRGQCVALKWRSDLDDQIDRIVALANTPANCEGKND